MEHFKEVPDVNRLIISPLYLREGLEFAKNQGYNDYFNINGRHLASVVFPVNTH